MTGIFSVAIIAYFVTCSLPTIKRGIWVLVILHTVLFPLDVLMDVLFLSGRIVSTFLSLLCNPGGICLCSMIASRLKMGVADLRELCIFALLASLVVHRIVQKTQ